MGRKWTPEQRAAASARAKAAIAAQQTEDDLPQTNQPNYDDVATATAPTEELTNDMPSVDVGDLLQMFQELKQENAYWRQLAVQGQAPQAPQGPQVGANGLIGTHTKYNVEKGYYPDPRERIAAESRLARFAFPLNYEMEWEVGVSSYKTIDGINTREPKFTLSLNRIVMNEDGEPTDGRYTICKAVFHEDPDAALIVARENGVTVEEWEEKAFLDEMRYIRMRNWVLEAFYAPKPAPDRKNKREMVVDGRVVEFFEINSEDPSSMPFGELSKKKML